MDSWTDLRRGWTSSRLLAAVLLLTASFPFAETAGASRTAGHRAIRVVDAEASQVEVAIDGDRLVWQDYRDSASDSEIYLLDLASGEEVRLTENAACQLFPDVSGNRVVWFDWRNASVTAPCFEPSVHGLAGGFESGADLYPEIFVHDIDSGIALPIPGIVPVAGGGVSIDGDRVAWIDYRNDQYDLYVRDLGTGIETRLTDQPGDRRNPRISGERVVWQDLRSGDSDIYLLDLGTGIETRLTDEPYPQFNPSIDGALVAWTEAPPDSDLRIVRLDLDTGEELVIEAVPPSSGGIIEVDGSSETVAWIQGGSGGSTVWALSLDGTGFETCTDAPANARKPAVSGSRVVWQEYAGGTGRWDLVLCELAPSASIFLDGFESGDLSGWSGSSSTGDGI